MLRTIALFSTTAHATVLGCAGDGTKKAEIDVLTLSALNATAPAAGSLPFDLLIDTRTTAEYNGDDSCGANCEYGRVPTAVHLHNILRDDGASVYRDPTDYVADSNTVSTLDACINQLGSDFYLENNRTMTIGFICRTGTRSRLLVDTLWDEGGRCAHIVNIDGGTKGWADASGLTLKEGSDNHGSLWDLTSCTYGRPEVSGGRLALSVGAASVAAAGLL